MPPNFRKGAGAGRGVLGHVAGMFPSADQNARPLDKASFATNPLVGSVMQETVRYEGGRALIPLWPNWSALLDEIPTFGKVLSITRNAHAVLGRIATYPASWAWSCCHCASAEDGSLEFDYSGWSRVSATVERRPAGWLYAVEFRDSGGEVLHKVCMTAGSDFEAFRSWVEFYQMTSSVTENASPCRERLDDVRHLCGDERVRLLGRGAIETIFREAISCGGSLRVVTGSDGAIQAAEMKPAAMRKEGQWLFASDESNGLHLRTSRLAEVAYYRVSEELSIIKAYEPEGRFVCALSFEDERLRERAEEFFNHSK